MQNIVRSHTDIPAALAGIEHNLARRAGAAGDSALCLLIAEELLR